MHYPSTPYFTYLRACRSGIRAMVRLGSPDFADCRSLGICEVFTDDLMSKGNCGTCVPAYLRLDAPTGRLLLHFDDRAISPAVRKRHFTLDGFTVLQPYRLSGHLLELVQLSDHPCFIAPGTYPVLDDGTFTTLSLRLHQAVSASLPVLRKVA